MSSFINIKRLHWICRYLLSNTTCSCFNAHYIAAVVEVITPHPLSYSSQYWSPKGEGSPNGYSVGVTLTTVAAIYSHALWYYRVRAKPQGLAPSYLFSIFRDTSTKLWLFDKAVGVSQVASEEKNGKAFSLRSTFFCPIATDQFERDFVFYLTDNATFFYLQALNQTDYEAWLQVLLSHSAVDASLAESKTVHSTISVVTTEVRGNDDYHGHGKYTWKSGKTYVGELKHGRFHGKGISTYSNGNRYEGSFASDLFNGQGTCIWKNGDVYVGHFKAGMFDGKGVRHCQDQAHLQILWRERTEPSYDFVDHLAPIRLHPSETWITISSDQSFLLDPLQTSHPKLCMKRNHRKRKNPIKVNRCKDIEALSTKRQKKDRLKDATG
ncbi:MORN repeat-containing protein [Planoprotostelium fungivorum]|uniref:MORN repeat-containing protein n=1 Tax=Planoprotostelium fungivorum TaxID=1890364 RepID=A0A2P6NUZ1_9EUKA|nr:MORN repeat-containing protein [Planoprotostelium fungivorum]